MFKVEKRKSSLVVVAHTFSLSTQETEVGLSEFSLQREF